MIILGWVLVVIGTFILAEPGTIRTRRGALTFLLGSAIFSPGLLIILSHYFPKGF